MNYTIKVRNDGNHIYNPLLKLAGREYATRDEACEAICSALNDVITGDGCEMIDQSSYRPSGDEFDEYWLDRYSSACHDYILREGWASEDGVIASVEEYFATFREVMNDHADFIAHADVSDSLFIEASCHTDDDELLDSPATFSIQSNWRDEAGVGRFDRDAATDRAIRSLCDQIAAKVGGRWIEWSDGQIVQANI